MLLRCFIRTLFHVRRTVGPSAYVKIKLTFRSDLFFLQKLRPKESVVYVGENVECHECDKATSLKLPVDVDGGIIWKSGSAEVKIPYHFLFFMQYNGIKY